jgi:hypothetical protein
MTTKPKRKQSAEPTWQTLKAAARRLGVTDMGKTMHGYEAYAPSGSNWYTTGCHTLIVEFDDPLPHEWAEMRAEMLDSIESGMHACTQGPDCDYCNPPDESEIGN